LGLSLIAMSVSGTVVILEAIFWLGMVIFVHELGHFLVAKWCGVKCEKFYLGFDIGGLKLAKFRWGETEYGIGILPLGGYVKMLGQDDNPSRAAEERERSQLAGETGTPALDPRSYMAKSVPQRMAIISAGVIMNLIFAVVAAVGAYSLGVQDLACGISGVLPGEAAWRANLQPGDRFIQINHSGDRPLRFRDLKTAVALGNIENGVDFEVEREGVPKPFWVNVKPDSAKNRLSPMIGVTPPFITKLRDDKVAYAGTPAAQAGFQPGDKIVAVEGTPVATYGDLLRNMSRLRDKPLQLTVERKAKDAPKDAPADTVNLNIEPRPMRTVGLVMKMGKITAVQADSPAEQADIRPGDFITAIDGQPPTDPMRLPDVLRHRAGETITLTLSREGPAGEIEKQVTLRDWPWPEELRDAGSPVAIPSLGLTYKVLNIVHQAEKGTPAETAELQTDDKPASVPRFAAEDAIVRADFIPPAEAESPSSKPRKVDEEAEEESDVLVTTLPKAVEFSDERSNWPYFISILQRIPADTQIKLTLKDGRTTTLSMVDATDWHLADRGMIQDVEITTTRAHSFSQAVSLGFREAKDAVTGVFTFLRRVGSQVSVYSLGGPKEIFMQASYAAQDGFAQLLIFLTMLSANLAVINFLPIPVLDGGHMVFLLLEGILRRPVSERVVVAFQYLGLMLVVSLMIFVLGLDIGLIPRPH